MAATETLPISDSVPTPFEFVIIFLIGGVIILATVGDDKSITNCVCAIISIGLMHLSVAGLRFRYPPLSRIFDGVPLVLLKDGEWQLDAMQGMRVDDNDVMAAARGKGVSKLEDIKYAILERNGSISIIKKTE